LAGLALLFLMDFWEETMKTLALVVTSAILALIIGIPLGIQTARSETMERIVRPILDFMQTMPAFVYLIPAILFFSVGNVPGVVATVVFALPPAVRLTNLGIRTVQQDVVEAAKAFGASERQLLYKVQIPLALPSILAGVNQVIMLSLSMVVIASMVGAAGLGQAVYKSILQADIGLGVESGLGIVIIAIVLDRITQAIGEHSSSRN
jgi:glycine betaine/proline transport system permease protein